MRVLILATDIYTRGGIARYTETLAEALSQLPASVDVLPLLGDAGANTGADEARRGHQWSGALQPRVIPAQAGIQAGEALEVDSRFRGNDEGVWRNEDEVCGNEDELGARASCPPCRRAPDGLMPEAGETPALPGTRFSYRILMPTTGRLTASAKIRHALRALRQAGQRYDLVICSHLGQAPIAALLRMRYGTPYLVVAHGSEAWVRLPAIKRLAVRRARAVLAVSAYTARTMARANGISSARMKVIYNAIPDDLVRALTRTGDPGGRPGQPQGLPVQSGQPQPQPVRSGLPQGPPRGPMLLSVASLKPEHAYKGVDTVIQALPQILTAVPEAHYIVAGAGEDRARLEQLASGLGVRDRVTFAGEVSDEELVELYGACDVFVLPSRASRVNGRGKGVTQRGSRQPNRPTVASGEWRVASPKNLCTPQRSSGFVVQGEGFGRVYVEAALAGKPVVGSVDGGAAEAVIDGRTGLLVDPRSVEQVASAVIRLLESPEWAAGLGVEGRRWALEQFTVAAMRKSLEEVLSSGVRSPLFAFRGRPPLGWQHSVRTSRVPGATPGNGQLTTDNNGQVTTDN